MVADDVYLQLRYRRYAIGIIKYFFQERHGCLEAKHYSLLAVPVHSEIR
jgi:hypothetical protein